MPATFTHQYTLTMMRHLTYGIRRLELLLREYSDSARKITSGNTVQAHAVHVQRFIMTAARSTAVVSPAVL